MTIEETKEAIRVMQAFVDGKKIRVANKIQPESWGELSPEPHWNWSHYRYEIKPEPKEFWIVDDKYVWDHKPVTFNSNLVHVREVV